MAKKILLVTADPKLQQLGSVAFEIVARWRLISARSLSEAISFAKTKAPDAIVLDSATAALDLAETEKSFGPEVPVILLASNANQGKPSANQPPTSRRSVAVSEHPRTLATDVAEVLGWQPPCASGRWKQNRGTAA